MGFHIQEDKVENGVRLNLLMTAQIYKFRMNRYVESDCFDKVNKYFVKFIVEKPR